MKKNLIVLLLSFLVAGSVFAYDEKAEAYFDYKNENIQSISGTYFTNTTEEDISIILQEYDYSPYGGYGKYVGKMKKAAWIKFENNENESSIGFDNIIWLSEEPKDMGNNFMFFASVLDKYGRTNNILVEFRKVNDNLYFARYVELE